MKRAIIIRYRMIFLFLTFFMFYSVSDGVYNVGGPGFFLMSGSTVFAQPRAVETVPVKDDTKAPSMHDSVLMNNLLEKQKQLDNREKALKDEELKVEALKKEVTEKMEALSALEEKATPSLEVQKAEKDKKYKILAKMYEATPADKAAAIFEKMERKMAAEILLRMSSKKAGAVWAYINRDIGVDIVREITASSSVDSASATRIAKEITSVGVIKPEIVQKIDAESTPKEIRKITESNKEKSKEVQPEAFKPYTIQIKAVRDLNAAQEYAKTLKGEGINAYWSAINTKDEGQMYRILVGHFASREEALRYMKSSGIGTKYPGSYVQKNAGVLPKKKRK
ncbi:MAG: SPOR domain-containing protein [Syntrophaceae bacterium]